MLIFFIPISLELAYGESEEAINYSLKFCTSIINAFMVEILTYYPNDFFKSFL